MHDELDELSSMQQLNTNQCLVASCVPLCHVDATRIELTPSFPGRYLILLQHTLLESGVMVSTGFSGVITVICFLAMPDSWSTASHSWRTHVTRYSLRLSLSVFSNLLVAENVYNSNLPHLKFISPTQPELPDGAPHDEGAERNRHHAVFAVSGIFSVRPSLHNAAFQGSLGPYYCQLQQTGKPENRLGGSFREGATVTTSPRAAGIQGSVEGVPLGYSH
ncbi:hypothetical protein B0H15DRAFT_383630 [Mycena belliarum]|uniref:Uncharacterized protein n=1 Tax=Mycena belliarum TaxID=1033014 RepID=A0AAD6TZM1_9AGAR|nr:hypothetical protein B0H15DRAFT_383630 [Mycena belliae]